MPFGSALAAMRARLCICLATTSDRRARSRSSSASASSTNRRVAARPPPPRASESPPPTPPLSPRDAPPRNEDVRARVVFARNPRRIRRSSIRRIRDPSRSPGREIASRRRRDRTRRGARANPRVGPRRRERSVRRAWTGRFQRDAQPRAHPTPPRPRPPRIRARRESRLGAPSPPRRLASAASASPAASDTARGEFRAKRRNLATRLRERAVRACARNGAGARTRVRRVRREEFRTLARGNRAVRSARTREGDRRRAANAFGAFRRAESDGARGVVAVGAVGGGGGTLGGLDDGGGGGGAGSRRGGVGNRGEGTGNFGRCSMGCQRLRLPSRGVWGLGSTQAGRAGGGVMPAPRRREGEPLARRVRSWSTSESVGVEAPSVRFEADRGGGSPRGASSGS